MYAKTKLGEEQDHEAMSLRRVIYIMGDVEGISMGFQEREKTVLPFLARPINSEPRCSVGSICFS